MSKDENIGPMGLAIGLPMCGRNVTPEWSIAFAMQSYPMNFNRYLDVVKKKPIVEARTKIVEAALEQKAKYLWFLDDDVQPPFFAARRLIYDLEQADDDVMVAGGIYVSKGELVEPIVYRGNGQGPFWKWKVGDVFDVTGIGTGCMMIKMELFEKLPKPWFKEIDRGPNGEWVNVHQSDDLYFCDRVVEAGYKLVADGNVICIHWDVTVDPAQGYSLPDGSYPTRPYDSPADRTSLSPAA
jgi:hypothetical protein